MYLAAPVFGIMRGEYYALTASLLLPAGIAVIAIAATAWYLTRRISPAHAFLFGVTFCFFGSVSFHPSLQTMGRSADRPAGYANLL